VQRVQCTSPIATDVRLCGAVCSAHEGLRCEHARIHKQCLCEYTELSAATSSLPHRIVLGWRPATPLALSETPCLTSCQHGASASRRRSVLLGCPETEPPMARDEAANPPMENRVTSTFPPGSSAANSAKETAIDVHAEPTTADPALSLADASPRARVPDGGARMAYELSKLGGPHHVIAPYRNCPSYSRVLS